jgi:threonyl-tRNA synthetase
MDEGGGCLLRPQDLSPGPRRHRSDLADVYLQTDFQLPERFELEYVGADNGRHRPIMIHGLCSAPVERFAMAVLIGTWRRAPLTWLSPEQVRADTPVTDAHSDYASVVDVRGRPACGPALRYDRGEDGRLIRRAKMALPYVLVVGDDDIKNGSRGQPAGLHREQAGTRRRRDQLRGGGGGKKW